jgi:hypothetical protein
MGVPPPCDGIGRQEPAAATATATATATVAPLYCVLNKKYTICDFFFFEREMRDMAFLLDDMYGFHYIGLNIFYMDRFV